MTMILAEIDAVQIIIVIIAMGAGFIQWLWGLVKEGRDRQERQRQEEQQAAPDPAELRRREEARRRLMEGRRREPPPVPKNRPAPGSPWETVRDVYEHLQEQSRKANAPHQPPRHSGSSREAEHPAPTRRPVPGTVRAELRPVPQPPPAPAEPFPVSRGDARPPVPSKPQAPVSHTPPVSFPAAPALPPRVTLPGGGVSRSFPAGAADIGDALSPRRRTSPAIAQVQRLLKTPHGLRQAILLQEILGPPKALQSGEGSSK